MKHLYSYINKLFTKIKDSRDGKILLSNFAYLSLLQVISYVFPLITIPYLARVIGVEGFGKIAFASSIVVYFQTIVDWGFSYTAVRDIAKYKGNKYVISIIFSNVIFSKILLLLVSTIIFSLFVYIIPIFRENYVILFITYLLVPGYILFPEWLFQAMEEMKYITLMNFFTKLFFTILVFFVIHDENDYIYQPLLSSFGMIISGLIGLLYALKKFDIKIIVPSIFDIYCTIKKSFNMFISLFLPNLYTNFSVTLLGFYGGDYATGIFSSGKKFVDLCDKFSMVLSRTFFPFLARRLDKHSIYVKISGSLSIIMGLFLFFASDLLVKLFYTEDFADSALIMKIMSVAPFFCFLMNTYGTNYLVLKGKENILRNIILVCSIGGFILAWIAIINFTYIGVAITITTVWGIRGGLTYHYAKKNN